MGRHTIPEHRHEIVVVFNRLFMAQNPSSSELTIQHPSSQCTLGNICPVETIHTVGPNHTLLLREDLDFPSTRPVDTSHLGVVPAHAIERWREPINEYRDPVESHLAAFSVEIKVKVVGIGGDDGVGIAGSVNGFFESFLDG